MDKELRSTISSFLHNLSNDFRDNKLTNEQEKIISEFYMKYMFNNTSNIETKDLIKFYTMGWYFYTHVLKEGE
tara:strand:+ start:649 stop:867 length:219 start_codon:yes stop_codon:yes gene_type:complete